MPLGFSPMCRALPQGLQRALLSLMQVHWGFSGHPPSASLVTGLVRFGVAHLASPFRLGRFGVRKIIGLFGVAV